MVAAAAERVNVGAAAAAVSAQSSVLKEALVGEDVSDIAIFKNNFKKEFMEACRNAGRTSGKTAGMERAAGKTAGMEETASAKTMEVEIVEFKSGAIGNIISTILKTKSIFSLNLQGDVNYYEILTSIYQSQ